MSPLNMSQLRDPEKRIEDGPRWESNGSQGVGCASDSSIAMRSRREGELKIQQEEQEEQDQTRSQDGRQLVKSREQQQRERYNEESSSTSEAKHKKSSGSSSKQPLPGFHQAFGSTEIGRFSRSEFFANIVGGDGNNVSNNSQNSCNSSSNLNDRTIEIGENCVNDDLEDSSSSSNNILVDNCSIVTRGRTNSSSSSSRNRSNRRDSNIDDSNSQGSGSNDNTNNSIIDQNTDSTSFNNSLTLAGNYYNDDRNMGPSGGSNSLVGVTTIPRWHSPYVNAIGSEI